jgi:pyruvate kinase
MIVKLIDEGLSLARLNFNHGDHQKQAKLVANVK